MKPMEEKTIDFEVIRTILPHRYPFLLVDRVMSVAESSIVALKNVTANEPFFNGHFPQMAVMPGVLQVEAMAQAAGLLLAHLGHFDTKKEIAFLAGIDDAKFRRLVVPGDQLMIHASIVARKINLIKVDAKILVEGTLASRALITLISKPLS